MNRKKHIHLDGRSSFGTTLALVMRGPNKGSDRAHKRNFRRKIIRGSAWHSFTMEQQNLLLSLVFPGSVKFVFLDTVQMPTIVPEMPSNTEVAPYEDPTKHHCINDLRADRNAHEQVRQ